MSSADRQIGRGGGEVVLPADDREYLSRYLSEEALGDLENVLRDRTPAAQALLIRKTRERAETWGNRAWFMALSDLLPPGSGS